jgi:hypothetical protein
MSETARKIYVPPNDEARIICDRCGFVQQTNVESFDLNRFYRVVCHCGNTFRIAIEKRAAKRVATHLEGIYAKVDNSYVSGKMVVENLSFFGIGCKAERQDDIQVDDVLRMKFTLDDEQQSVVVKEVLIKWVYEDTMGGEFCDYNAYDQELIAYFDQRP